MQSIHRNALNKFYATCSVEAATITTAVIARSKCELDPEILCEHRPVLTRNVNTPELVGRCLADVERDLILETLKFLSWKSDESRQNTRVVDPYNEKPA